MSDLVANSEDKRSSKPAETDKRLETITGEDVDVKDEEEEEKKKGKKMKKKKEKEEKKKKDRRSKEEAKMKADSSSPERKSTGEIH